METGFLTLNKATNSLLNSNNDQLLALAKQIVIIIVSICIGYIYFYEWLLGLAAQLILLLVSHIIRMYSVGNS